MSVIGVSPCRLIESIYLRVSRIQIIEELYQRSSALISRAGQVQQVINLVTICWRKREHCLQSLTETDCFTKRCLGKRFEQTDEI